MLIMTSLLKKKTKGSHSRWKTTAITSIGFALTVATAVSTAQPAVADEWHGFNVGGKILEEFIELGRPWNATGPERDAARNGRFQEFGSNSIYWHGLVSGGHANQIGGKIREKWELLNWEHGFLQYPTTRESQANGGRFNHFEGGSIYWSGSTGAQQVGGLIRDKWASMGWENGKLGFPTTDEFNAGGGSGRGNHFQGGSVYYSPQGGTHPVWGAIRDQWMASGWENGQYGYPTSDEYDYLGGKAQDFQNGKITWGTQHGSITNHWYGYEVYMDKWLVDKLTLGGIAGLGGLATLGAALGVLTNPAGPIIAAVGVVAVAAIAACKDPNGGVTFYITGNIPPLWACNPFSGFNRSAPGGEAMTDEGTLVTDGDAEYPHSPVEAGEESVSATPTPSVPSSSAPITGTTETLPSTSSSVIPETTATIPPTTSQSNPTTITPDTSSSRVSPTTSRTSVAPLPGN